MSPHLAVGLVGDVPESVRVALQQHGCRLVVLSPDLGGADVRHVVMHVDGLEAPQEVLERAYEDGIRVGLTTSRPRDQAQSRLLFHPAVLPMMPLTQDPSRCSAFAVRIFLHEWLEPDPVDTEDIEIGRYFQKVTTLAEYQGQRFLSLSGPAMHDFLVDLRDAADAMSLGLPTGGMPWFHDDSGQPARRAKTGDLVLGDRPNLSDVFDQHGTARGRQLMRASAEERAAAASWRPAHLLITGESGAGKTLVAGLVHELLSQGTPGGLPMLTINCGGLPAENLDHELFGAAKGTWTGIDAPVVGLLARAAYGVAFFDEVGDLTMRAQQRLLVFIGDGILRPFGMEPFPAYTRIIAATNRDLPYLVRQNRFRNDLHERFAKQVHIPPLRDRDVDERAWLIDFVAVNPLINPGTVTHIGQDAMAALQRHEFRNGNFRELERVIQDGIGRTRRRGSAILRERDLAFSDVSSVADADAATIDIVSDDALGSLPRVDLASRGDLDRIAGLTGAPVLREPNGNRAVLFGGVRYVLVVDKT